MNRTAKKNQHLPGMLRAIDILTKHSGYTYIKEDMNYEPFQDFDNSTVFGIIFEVNSGIGKW